MDLEYAIYYIEKKESTIWTVTSCIVFILAFCLQPDGFTVAFCRNFPRILVALKDFIHSLILVLFDGEVTTLLVTCLVVGICLAKVITTCVTDQAFQKAFAKQSMLSTGAPTLVSKATSNPADSNCTAPSAPSSEATPEQQGATRRADLSQPPKAKLAKRRDKKKAIKHEHSAEPALEVKQVQPSPPVVDSTRDSSLKNGCNVEAANVQEDVQVLKENVSAVPAFEPESTSLPELESELEEKETKLQDANDEIATLLERHVENQSPASAVDSKGTDIQEEKDEAEDEEEEEEEESKSVDDSEQSIIIPKETSISSPEPRPETTVEDDLKVKAPASLNKQKASSEPPGINKQAENVFHTFHAKKPWNSSARPVTRERFAGLRALGNNNSVTFKNQKKINNLPPAPEKSWRRAQEDSKPVLEKQKEILAPPSNMQLLNRDKQNQNRAKLPQRNCVEERSASQPATLLNFLQNLDLEEYYDKFAAEKLDLQTLTMLSDRDIECLGLPLGPRKRIQMALNLHRSNLRTLKAKVEDAPVPVALPMPETQVAPTMSFSFSGAGYPVHVQIPYNFPPQYATPVAYQTGEDVSQGFQYNNGKSMRNNKVSSSSNNNNNNNNNQESHDRIPSATKFASRMENSEQMQLDMMSQIADQMSNSVLDFDD